MAYLKIGSSVKRANTSFHFVSISDRKDRAIELTESKFYIKSRRQLESEREGTRRFEAPINEDRGDAEWRERMLHWEGEPLSQ